MFRPFFGVYMRQLIDKNGRLRVCTRCNRGNPAVFKKSGEYLCEACLARRKERQAETARLPKCCVCNGLAMKGSIYCNNHIPEPEVPKFESNGIVVMRHGYFEVRLFSGLPADLLGKNVQVVLTEREVL